MNQRTRSCALALKKSSGRLREKSDDNIVLATSLIGDRKIIS